MSHCNFFSSWHKKKTEERWNWIPWEKQIWLSQENTLPWHICKAIIPYMAVHLLDAWGRTTWNMQIYAKCYYIRLSLCECVYQSMTIWIHVAGCFIICQLLCKQVGTYTFTVNIHAHFSHCARGAVALTSLIHMHKYTAPVSLVPHTHSMPNKTGGRQNKEQKREGGICSTIAKLLIQKRFNP